MSRSFLRPGPGLRDEIQRPRETRCPKLELRNQRMQADYFWIRDPAFGFTLAAPLPASMNSAVPNSHPRNANAGHADAGM